MKTVARAAALSVAVGGPSAAQDVASVTYGPYLRAELGYGWNRANDGFWESPGPADPRVFFGLDAGNGATGGLAVGFDWQNGIRADVGVLRLTGGDVSGPCIGASDGSPCDIGGLDNHADIERASFASTALMASVFYAPLEARGSNSRFQPFVVGGLGISHNEVGRWTRENSSGGDGGRITRTFEGDTSSDLAWSLGVGASWQVTRPGQRPIIVEASWRYYDLGEAKGGRTPLPGEGNSEPREPLTFDATSSVVAIGVRIPLQRY